jgi:cytochrome bd ubiquinol oxidase subunit II
MPLEHWIAGAILASLTAYVLGAGADFGGGVWDLLAFGPRARAQRDLIAHAIGPIWEANHVWLILVVVLLFVCFPVGFAAITTALHVPLTVMLIGIVLRGSAFTFRSYGHAPETEPTLDNEGGTEHMSAQRWGRVFAIASLLTPVTLGLCVGAIASGAIRMREGRVLVGFFESWLSPFPIVIGLFAVALFAFLAAVYLTMETTDAALRDDFRRRALAAGVAVGLLAFTALGVAARDAPLVYSGLVVRHVSPVFQAITGACAVGALAALWRRRYPLARALAIAQTSLILWGWGWAQFPHLIPPDLTFTAAAAPVSVLRLVLIALAAGGALLVPSLIYLFRLFKASQRH